MSRERFYLLPVIDSQSHVFSKREALLAFAQLLFISVCFLSFIQAWILYVSHLDFQCTVISSKNSRGHFFFHTKGEGFLKGRRLFQILLTGSHALYILFIVPLNQKMITSNKLNMGFLSVPNLFPWLNFNVNILCIRA